MGLLPTFCFSGAGITPKAEDIARLRRAAERVASSHGLEIFVVQLRREPIGTVLRVIIDRPDPGRVEALEESVGIDECQRVSQDLSALLDVEDEFGEADLADEYTLEVSSPGLDRPLFTPAQFARFAGQSAKLSLNVPLGGRRRFQGPIKSVDGERITIEQDGNDVVIEHGNVLKANLVPEFEPKGEKKGGDKPGKTKGGGKAKRKH